MTAAPPRFKLFPALWTAAQRLRHRWSPLLAIAVCLVGLPSALVSATYAGQASDWGGLAVGAAVGTILTGLATGAGAWLALAPGEDPWRVGIEGLGRAFYKLSPLAGLTLLLNLPVLLYSALLLVTRGDIPLTSLDNWIWWGLALLAIIIPAVVTALIAPAAGVLMFEGGDMWPAVGRALVMTRGSRPKLLALEILGLLSIQGASYGVARLTALMDGMSHWGLWALANALILALFSLVRHQAYMQLHDAGDLA